MIRRVAMAVSAVFCVAVALGLLLLSAAQVDGASADWRMWVLVYAGIALSLSVLWIGARTLGGRNPIGRRPGHVWRHRPRRLPLAAAALAYAVLVGTYMVSSLGFPPVGAEPVTLASILLVIAFSAYGAATVARVRGARGRRVVVWMGAWSAVVIVLAALRLPWSVTGHVGPAMALALIITSSMWGAVAIAGLLVWSVRGAWHPPAADLPDVSSFPSLPAGAERILTG